MFNFCVVVVGLVWVWINWIAGPIDWGRHFRMGIILWTIPSWFLVFCVRAPGCSLNGSGENLKLWVPGEIVYFGKSTQMSNSVLLNSWDSFLVTLPSISSKTCVIHSSLILGTDVFCDWPFLGCSFCVSLETAANIRLFSLLLSSWKKNLRVVETELSFYQAQEYNVLQLFLNE